MYKSKTKTHITGAYARPIPRLTAQNQERDYHCLGLEIEMGITISFG